MRFYFTVMIHWSKVMFTYDMEERILFSVNIFDAFKTLSEDLYADEINFNKEYLEEAGKYYSIIKKYGAKV